MCLADPCICEGGPLIGSFDPVYKTISSVNRRSVFQNNIRLSAIFHRMADCYRYVGEDRFRAIAYENVANILLNMKEDIARYAGDISTLDQIGGIGKSIAGKIIEYLQTGKIKTFEKLKKNVPYKLLELMDIRGFGPATLRTLHEELGIHDREELIRALEAGRLQGVRGFGKKKIEAMRRMLKLQKSPGRMPLAIAKAIGNEILGEIREIPGVQKAELAGSIRRGKETIGDIDIIILAEPSERKKIVERFTRLRGISKILAKGTTRASAVLKTRNVQVDIRLVHDYEYGSAMLYFTGSKEHNIKLRIRARELGFKINEYGLFETATGKRLAGSTEEEIYDRLKLRFIPPEKRLDTGEIEAAVRRDV
ncbi:MAG: helix-hairpin-helix domain-containing protein [Chitinophagaceae bacterium]